MILIADSGSTKCSWALCDKKGTLIKEIKTIGFNPYFINKPNILKHLEKSELNQYKNEIMFVFFYGAGCSSKEKNNVIKLPFKRFFKNAKIKISHDLDAACLAMYNGKANITCILGTGSNSCLYDGKKIIKKSPSLGFILGDEASGNYFGKKIVNLYFNNQLPSELSENLEAMYETDISVINKKIYNNRANVFLSQYFPFFAENKNHPLIKKIIKDALIEFINIHIKCFDNCNKVDINFIGSVSYFLSEEIKESLKENNLITGEIIKNPINKLIKFHSEEIQKVLS